MRTLSLGGSLALLAPLLVLGACKKDKDDTGSPDDSGVTDSGDTSDTSDSDTGDTQDSNLPCTVAVTSTDPTDGETDIYYRDVYTVSFDGDGAAAEIDVLDSAGTPVKRVVNWSEGNVQAYIQADLLPSNPYTLHVSSCGVDTDVAFTTSDLGTPILDGPSSIVGHTYMIQLSEAKITTPAVLQALASQYLTVPLLFDVTQADETSLTFLGGLGEQNDDGTYSQIGGLPTWDFPAGDFSESPYFASAADYITLMYGDIAIPIEEFTLDGVFTSDGNYIREGRATGKADTRYMGPLFNQPADAYGALCDLAGSLGVYCEPCADGNEYCLYIEAEQIEATYQPGLTVVPYPAE